MIKTKGSEEIKTLVFIGIATLLQVFTLKAVVQPANLLPSGFLGLSVLVQNMTTWLVPGGIPLHISTLAFNIPVALLCAKGISKRFAMYSMLQVFLSSFFLSIFQFQPLFNDTLLSVVIGGVLNGLYVTIALTAGASTGGTDFVALYVSNKKGKSIWEYVFIANCILLIIFGVTSGWVQAGYSILFQFVATKTIETFHHRYEQLTLQITTPNAEEIMDYYFDNHKHGMTCVEAVGGYTHRKVYILYTIISSYELKEVTKGILKTDPTAIINVMKTQQFYGNFYRAKQ